jgi:hypothetical protein
MLLGDISLMTGDTQSAMKNYLKEAVARFGLIDGGISQRHRALQGLIFGNTPNRIPPYAQRHPQQVHAGNTTHWTVKTKKPLKHWVFGAL